MVFSWLPPMLYGTFSLQMRSLGNSTHQSSLGDEDQASISDPITCSIVLHVVAIFKSKKKVLHALIAQEQCRRTPTLNNVQLTLQRYKTVSQ